MLVIARRSRQRLFIGNVEIVVVDIDRGEVKLGIIAPKDVLILRAELARETGDDDEKDPGPDRA